jgi:hypothetical protein
MTTTIDDYVLICYEAHCNADPSDSCAPTNASENFARKTKYKALLLGFEACGVGTVAAQMPTEKVAAISASHGRESFWSRHREVSRSPTLLAPKWSALSIRRSIPQDSNCQSHSGGNKGGRHRQTQTQTDHQQMLRLELRSYLLRHWHNSHRYPNLQRSDQQRKL